MSTIPKQSNIVSYWKGNLDQNGDLFDSVGSNHGTLVSAPPQVETPYGSALDYDGSADTVSYADTGNLFNFSKTDDFTISSLVKFDTVSVTRSLVHRRNTTGYALQLATDKADFFTDHTTDGNKALNGTTTIATGVWYLFTAVMSGQVKHIYTNDIHENSADISSFGDISESGLTLFIGKDNNNSSFLDGIIAHTIIYNTGLNPNEVKQLYLAIQRLTAKR